MTDKNKMGKLEYVLFNIYFALVMMAVFRSRLFIPLKYHTAGSSKAVLWILIISMITLGILTTFKRRRNYLSVTVNVLLPFQVYSLIGYADTFSVWIKVTLAAATAFSAIYLYLVLALRGNRRLNTRHVLLGVRTLAALGFCIFFVPIFVKSYVSGDLYSSKNSGAVISGESYEWNVVNNLDTLKKLESSVWKTLSYDERLEVLSVVKNIETKRLGINHEIYLTTGNLGTDTLGSYVDNEHKIIISLEHLNTSEPEEVVHTLVHECHHVYTRQQVELYESVPDEYKNMLMFEEVKEYQREYANYIDGSIDYDAYIRQLCETNANQYASVAVSFYYGVILESEGE